MMKEKLLEKFQDVYGDINGTKVYFAPGRVNLIGEHIDYSGGLVLPCALTLGTYGVARRRADKKIKVYSMNMEDEIQEIAIGDYQVVNESDWTNYIKGVLWAFEKKWYCHLAWICCCLATYQAGRDFLPQHLWKC